MNIKQKTLAALLVLGIGMSGCNNNDNNPAPPTDNNKNEAVDQNKTGENNDTDKKPDKKPPVKKPPVENNNTEENRTATILGYIGSQHSNHNSTITVAQLREITPALSNIDDRYLNIYQRYIASADTNISSPATTAELQSMINEVNAFNLPTNAILDRSFFKKTNGAFEHRFVYLPVTNSTTGRTWLNNNLGADYANVDSSDYNPSQQATAYNDYLAYGSLFQWGRKADGHELMNWVTDHNGTTKYGDTNVTNDNPSDSLFIKQRDWRVNQDDTLWASESSPNNVCPVGYRLPLAPDAVVDAENELDVELNSWDSKDADGSMSSALKLPMAGGRKTNGDIAWTANYGIYWSGSVVPSDGNNSTVSNARDVYFGLTLGLLDTSGRGNGLSVRCIKDQTPAERSNSILLEIGNEHHNHKSTVTVAQLKAITPALENINDEYQDSYRSYIASADTSFSSPATRAEVQSMIDAVNASKATLVRIGQDHHNTSSTITVADLRSIFPSLNNIDEDNIQKYRDYITSADNNFSTPATRKEVQIMVDTANLYTIGSLETAGNTMGVALSEDGTMAYVADGLNGLVVVDISDPAHPTKLGTYDTVGFTVDVTLSSDGTKAYISDGFNGLVILDISNPAHPTKLGSYGTAGNARHILLSSDGTKAYLADWGDALVILDISNPAHPTKLASYDTDGKSMDITLSSDGTKAYVADDTNGLVIVDISDPAHPTKLGSYDTAGKSIDITLSSDGTKAYIADDTNGLVIVDISDPAHPTKLGSYDTAGRSLSVAISSDNTKAYIADYNKGLVIINISDSAHPTKLSSYKIATGAVSVYGVALSSDGTKIYVTDQKKGLFIIGN